MAVQRQGKSNPARPSSLPSNASATITLAKPSFSVGEVLRGELVLNVRGVDQLSVEGVTITLKGLEEYEWKISSDEDDGFYDRKASKQFLYDEVRLPISLEKPIAPGQHVFPFELPLATRLPPSFRHDKYQFPSVVDLRGGVVYMLEATTRLQGIGVAHTTSLPVAVYAMTPPGAPTRPLQLVETKRVKFLCCFDMGTCELSVASNTDAFDLNMGAVAVRVSVVNGTKMGIVSLDARLRREVHLSVPSGCHHNKEVKATDDLGEFAYREAIPAGSKRENIPVEFSMARAAARLPLAPRLVSTHPASPVSPKLIPTCKTSLSSVSYRMRVTLRFATSLCSCVTLEMPIVLKHFRLADATAELNTVELRVE